MKKGRVEWEQGSGRGGGPSGRSGLAPRGWCTGDALETRRSPARAGTASFLLVRTPLFVNALPSPATSFETRQRSAASLNEAVRRNGRSCPSPFSSASNLRPASLHDTTLFLSFVGVRSARPSLDSRTPSFPRCSTPSRPRPTPVRPLASASVRCVTSRQPPKLSWLELSWTAQLAFRKSSWLTFATQGLQACRRAPARSNRLARPTRSPRSRRPSPRAVHPRLTVPR